MAESIPSLGRDPSKPSLLELSLVYVPGPLDGPSTTTSKHLPSNENVLTDLVFNRGRRGPRALGIWTDRFNMPDEPQRRHQWLSTNLNDIR